MIWTFPSVVAVDVLQLHISNILTFDVSTQMDSLSLEMFKAGWMGFEATSGKVSLPMVEWLE